MAQRMAFIGVCERKTLARYAMKQTEHKWYQILYKINENALWLGAIISRRRIIKLCCVYNISPCTYNHLLVNSSRDGWRQKVKHSHSRSECSAVKIFPWNFFSLLFMGVSLSRFFLCFSVYLKTVMKILSSFNNNQRFHVAHCVYDNKTIKINNDNGNGTTTDTNKRTSTWHAQTLTHTHSHTNREEDLPRTSHVYIAERESDRDWVLK